VTELLDSCLPSQPARKPAVFLRLHLTPSSDVKERRENTSGGSLRIANVSPWIPESLNPKTNSSCFLTPSPV